GRQQDVEQLARGERRVADRGGIEVERLRRGDADRNRVAVRRHNHVLENGAERGDGTVEVSAPIAEIRAERDGYSIHRVGSTSPCDGSSTSARRPRRSVRPASACSKKRFCSSTSPRITRSILA